MMQECDASLTSEEITNEIVDPREESKHAAKDKSSPDISKLSITIVP